MSLYKHTWARRNWEEALRKDLEESIFILCIYELKSWFCRGEKENIDNIEEKGRERERYERKKKREEKRRDKYNKRRERRKKKKGGI